MKTCNLIISMAVGLIYSSLASVAIAEEKIEVMAAEGSVFARELHGKDQKPVQAKSVLPGAAVLSTGATSRAVVKVGSTGMIVVGKNSEVEITQPKDKPGFFRQISGLVYYAVNAVKGKKNAVEVKTATSVIGIRGTRFLVVDDQERKEIGMRKGEVNVSSPEGDFEIHKQAQVDEFEAFKKEGEAAIQKANKEFEEYKAKTQQEFVEFKKEFSLSANRMVSFDGKKVSDKPLGGDTQKDMESIESYAESWLDKIRD